jgi:hypothetical protein
MSVLGTTVFKVPELGELGYRLDQANEKKRAAAQAKLEKKIQATGADKTYAESGMGLTGKWKQMSDLGFEVYRRAALDFEETGSADAEARMNTAARNLNYYVSSGKSILSEMGKEYQNAQNEGFSKTSLNPTEASNLYTSKSNDMFGDDEIFIGNDGVSIIVKDVNGNLVEGTQSSYVSTNVTGSNALLLPALAKEGKYVNFRNYTNDQLRAITSAASEAEAKDNVTTLLDSEMDNPALQNDMIVSYGKYQLGQGKEDDKLSDTEYFDLLEKGQNEEYRDKAFDWYRGKVLEEVPPLYKGGSTSRVSGYGTGTSYNFTIDQDTKQVLSVDKDGKTKKTIEIDDYIGLPSITQAKGVLDPISNNRYNIQGIGIRSEGGKSVFVMDRVMSEGAEPFSLDSGKQYRRYISPATLSEFRQLPAKTQRLLEERVAEVYDQEYYDILESNLIGFKDNEETENAKFDFNEYLSEKGLQ